MNGDTWEYHVDGRMICWLEERPAYCNRGRWKAIAEYARDPRTEPISDCDWWPRYYFNLDYAKSELLQWLSAHGVKIDGGAWRFNPAPPGTIDMDELVNRVERQ